MNLINWSNGLYSSLNYYELIHINEIVMKFYYILIWYLLFIFHLDNKKYIITKNAREMYVEILRMF